MDKVNFNEFVQQVSKRSGYAQKHVREILLGVSECIVDNLMQDTSSTVVPGIIIYPSVYPAIDKIENGKSVHYDEVTYPRARFGQAFKKQMLIS